MPVSKVKPPAVLPRQGVKFSDHKRGQPAGDQKMVTKPMAVDVSFCSPILVR